MSITKYEDYKRNPFTVIPAENGGWVIRVDTPGRDTSYAPAPVVAALSSDEDLIRYLKDELGVC